MSYTRPWMSFSDQLAQLQSRGMDVGDQAAALSYLERIGYYRLSAYWYPFRIWQIRQDPASGRLANTRTDQFVAGTHFLDAVSFYLFDKQLRLLAVDALERIEVALRVDIAYQLGRQHTFAHLDPAALHPSFAGKSEKDGRTVHQAWRARYEQLVARSREDFVEHYHRNHGTDLPIWVAVELWDFGTLSQLFAMMNVADQQHIAHKYGVADWKVFQSWLRSLSYLRNLVAHHSRLWNRNVVSQPKLPAAGLIDWCDHFAGQPGLTAKPFLLLSICRHLVRQICPRTEWHQRLRVQIKAFPVQHASKPRSVADMGAPSGWESWW